MFNTHRFFGGLRVLLPLLAAFSCVADDLVLVPNGASAGTDPRAFMIGWKFATTTSFSITALAYCDPAGSGLKEAHQVGIFDANSGAVLVSAIVPAGAATKYVNGFRTVPVTYTLAPGTYVIGALKPSDADNALRAATSVTTIPGVQYIEERELQTGSFTMPTTNFSLNESGSFGPDFIAASTAANPTVSSVVNSGSYQPTFANNTYISLFGTNLATTTRTWLPADFINGTGLPTSLDGVSATVGGVPAYVEYVSSSQINLITPAIAATGPGVPVVLNTPAKSGITVWVSMQAIAPAFFPWLTPTADSGKYLVAQHLDFTNVGKVGLYPNLAPNFTTPAKPGETIVLYGTSFGATSPAIAQGIITDHIYPLTTTPTATVGGLNATVTFAGLIPPLSQVYQVNLQIPATAPDGDLPVIVVANGVQSAAGLITVAH